MEEDHKKSPQKSTVAKHRPRDEDGHFLSEEEAKKNLAPSWSSIFSSSKNHNSTDDDDKLIDIEVNNPLHKITKLLEDIKKQKAFSFTLRGSLGVMGVFLALGVFGIFGGGQILCDKGIQSQIGTVKTLQYTESDPGPSIPLLSDILDYFVPKTEHNRTVLIRPDASLVRLPYARFISFENYENKVVIVTGSYDACSQKLVVKDPSAIQIQ